MERISLKSGLNTAVEKAAQVLEANGVVLYPTDTLYGLGADAFSDEAVDKIYAVKGRDEKKPIHCIVADVAMAEEYAEMTDDARLLFERLTLGGLTIILKKKNGVEGGIARGIETIGIRIPKSDFCLQLAQKFGRPFTATSANISGLAPERLLEKILTQLGISAEHIDLVVDGGEMGAQAPSTVVDLSGEEPAILREGAVPAADVWNTIRAERDN